jgi:hypothetical protein
MPLMQRLELKSGPLFTKENIKIMPSDHTYYVDSPQKFQTYGFIALAINEMADE